MGFNLSTRRLELFSTETEKSAGGIGLSGTGRKRGKSGY